MKKSILVVLVLVVLAALALPGTVLAKGLHEDKIVTGGLYTLASGETLDGSLVIFGGVVTRRKIPKLPEMWFYWGGLLPLTGPYKGMSLAWEAP